MVGVVLFQETDWETEMILSHNVTLPKDTISLVWISSANVLSVLNKGYRLIHAASDFFYLVRIADRTGVCFLTGHPGLWGWWMGRVLPWGQQLVRSVQDLAKGELGTMNMDMG